MKDLEDLLDEIQSMARKRDKLILELDEIQKSLEKKAEEYNELDPTKIKINCIICGGKGWQEVEGKKRVCPGCNSFGYMWGTIFVEEKEKPKEDKEEG